MAQETGLPRGETVHDYLALDARQLAKIGARISAAERGELAIAEEILRVRVKFTPQP
jgi:hypothetical protein